MQIFTWWRIHFKWNPWRWHIHSTLTSTITAPGLEISTGETIILIVLSPKWLYSICESWFCNSVRVTSSFKIMEFRHFFRRGKETAIQRNGLREDAFVWISINILYSSARLLQKTMPPTLMTVINIHSSVAYDQRDRCNADRVLAKCPWNRITVLWSINKVYG